MQGLCPTGCPTNHGGPSGGSLPADWRDIPAEDRPAWPDFVEYHGRRDLVATTPPNDQE